MASTATIYRKSDNKRIGCDVEQIALMCDAKDSNYSRKPVDLASPEKTEEEIAADKAAADKAAADKAAADKAAADKKAATKSTGK